VVGVLQVGPGVGCAHQVAVAGAVHGAAGLETGQLNALSTAHGHVGLRVEDHEDCLDVASQPLRSLLGAARSCDRNRIALVDEDCVAPGKPGRGAAGERPRIVVADRQVDARVARHDRELFEVRRHATRRQRCDIGCPGAHPGVHGHHRVLLANGHDHGLRGLRALPAGDRDAVGLELAADPVASHVSTDRRDERGTQAQSCRGHCGDRPAARRAHEVAGKALLARLG
jgi:hypothetical protein